MTVRTFCAPQQNEISEFRLGSKADMARIETSGFALSPYGAAWAPGIAGCRTVTSERSSNAPTTGKHTPARVRFQGAREAL
jgi:hypothetical protein